MSDQPSALITGGCGFIGVNLGRLLVERGWSVTAFDSFVTGSRTDGERAGMKVVEGDVRDGERLADAAASCEYVVHLAAHTNVVESVADPRLDVDVNVDGTLNALLAARQAGVAGFVFASSNAPLGEIDPPAREDKVPSPLSPYGASKLAGEALCAAFGGSYGLPTTVLRFSNAYGPFSYHKGSVVAAFMKRIVEGRPITIYGDGEQTRDFVYVGDICAGIAAALESGLGGEVFHLGSGVETSVNTLTAKIRALFPEAAIDVRHEPERAGEIKRNYSDIGKAARVLGYRPAYDLDAGLTATARWFREVYAS